MARLGCDEFGEFVFELVDAAGEFEAAAEEFLADTREGGGLELGEPVVDSVKPAASVERAGGKLEVGVELV